MKEAGSAEQFRLLQQEIVLAGEAVEKLKRDQQLSGASSFLLSCGIRRVPYFFLPFRIPPYRKSYLLHNHDSPSQEP
jgi:hypothetical protein